MGSKPTPGGAMTGGMMDQQSDATARMRENAARQEKPSEQEQQAAKQQANQEIAAKLAASSFSRDLKEHDLQR